MWPASTNLTGQILMPTTRNMWMPYQNQCMYVVDQFRVCLDRVGMVILLYSLVHIAFVHLYRNPVAAPATVAGVPTKVYTTTELASSVCHAH